MNEMIMQAMQAYQEMQKRVAAVQGRLKEMKIEQAGGDGIVIVTVTAEGRIEKVNLDLEKAGNEEKEIVEDVVASTINKALQEAEATRDREMQSATEGLMPDVPGMNFPGQGQ